VEPEVLRTDVEAFLDQPLPVAPTLKLGQLDNGLRYVILPNKLPPNRFEAHLEMHVGAVNENENQQGLAHVVEHVTFLGSKKRERLLGTGARSNAYTDFHHTVFHIHSPLHNAGTKESLMPQVLDALTEIAFEPEMLATRLEKERLAVLSEAQMMNTIEYRVDCQLLTYLHAENLLGERFPIGSTDQVKKWDIHNLREFWQRWYFPANATLYLVGDFDQSVDSLEAEIHKRFGKIPAGRMLAPGEESYQQRQQKLLAASVANANGSTSNGQAGNGAPAPQFTQHPRWNATEALLSGEGPYKQRFEKLPNVEHRWGSGPLQPGEQPVVAVFRHRLLQQYMLSIFSKLPVQKITRMRDVMQQVMSRIVLCVLHFRISARYQEANPPFTSIEMDHSDSAREGCTVSTLTIVAEPCDWQGAVQVAVQELRRLGQFGLTRSEVERYREALLRDSEQLASQGDSIASLDQLNFVMEYLALGHTYMQPQASHEVQMALADLITVEEVNKVARSLMSFVSHFGKEEEALQHAAANPDHWLPWGPSRTTCIVACIPAFTDRTGHSTGGEAPAMAGRGGGVLTTQHVEPPGGVNVDAAAEAAARKLLEGENPDASQIPEGAVPFEVPQEDILQSLSQETPELEAQPDIDVPVHLLSSEQVEELMARHQPHFVPVGAAKQVVTTEDPDTGVVQLKLSNGIGVNFRRSVNEPQSAMFRLIASGGRACEGPGPAADGTGMLPVGVRTLNESGSLGVWERPQIELFCICHLINVVLDVDEEWIVMDVHFAVGQGGLTGVLEMAHLMLEAPDWDQAALDRAKSLYISHYRSLEKSLERASADRVMNAMLGPDRRFREPTVEDVEALTLEKMRDCIRGQMRPENVEISIVGDLTAAEVEEEVLKYLGTVSPKEPPQGLPQERPLKLANPGPELRHQRWHLQDSDERAVAYIAGPAPTKWSTFASPRVPLAADQEVIPPSRPQPMAPAAEVQEAATVRRAHPMYASVTLSLLVEIINSRLFTTVRDSLGLTYDVNFDLPLFDRLQESWYVVVVTSTPQKIQQALEASVGVMRTLTSQRISVRELARAQRTLLTRHESETKDNAFWLRQLTHLQNDAVPLKRLECLRDYKRCMESATVDDLYDALKCFKVDDNSIFTVIGTSGSSPPPPRVPTIKPNASHFQAFADAAKKVQSVAGVMNLLNSDRFPKNTS